MNPSSDQPVQPEPATPPADTSSAVPGAVFGAPVAPSVPATPTPAPETPHAPTPAVVPTPPVEPVPQTNPAPLATPVEPPVQPVPALTALPNTSPAIPVDAAQDLPEPSQEGERHTSQSYGWEASEYIYHEKPAWWYIALWAVAAIICGVLAITQQWTGIAVVVVATLALLVYSKKPPQTLNYNLDDDGITIEGKPNSFDLYRSYSVYQEVGWHEVDLEAVKRFRPRLTLICESEDVDRIDDILSDHLPRVDRNPDWIERASRYLKF